MNNTTEIKIEERNIFEVRNKDLIRWVLPVLKKISKVYGEGYLKGTDDFLDYLEEETK